MYSETMPSPILPRTAVARLIGTVSTSEIARLYEDNFRYSTAQDFAGLDEIAIYECQATGYRFYYPYSLEGKEPLYRAIEDFDWTYQEDKWEHERALTYIADGDAVLDVGCGRGAFLDRAKGRSDDVTGIELNGSAASFARKRGLTVIPKLVSEHAKDCAAKYDVVTSFQVLEHVADPVPFLRDCIACLKIGGLLILGVPNNDSFLQFARDNILNQPPHHVGLWNAGSLAALPGFLPIELVSMEDEPLRELHWYQQVMERRYLPKRWQRSLYYRLGGHRIFKRFIEENSHTISGHTIMAVYRRSN